MSTTIQRDPTDAESFYLWDDGATLGHNAEVVCGPDEAIAFADDTGVLAVVGPGRTVLTPATHPTLARYLERHLLSAQPELSVCFVQTSPSPDWEVSLDVGMVPGADGRVGQMGCWASLTLQVSNVELFVAKLVSMEEAAVAAGDAAAAEDAATGDDGYDDTIDETDVEEGDEEGDEDEEPNAITFFLEKAVRTAVAQVLVEDRPADAGINAAVQARLADLVSAELEQFGLAVASADQVEMSRDDVAIE